MWGKAVAARAPRVVGIMSDPPVGRARGDKHAPRVGGIDRHVSQGPLLMKTRSFIEKSDKQSVKPERWSVDAGSSGVAQLEIPPDLRRDRTFEISCSLAVVWRGNDSEEDEEHAAWHGLTLRVDGRQQWSRRVATHPGPGDSLDYRFRHRLAAGESLRLVAASEVKRSVRLALLLSAEEELPDG